MIFLRTPHALLMHYLQVIDQGYYGMLTWALPALIMAMVVGFTAVADRKAREPRVNTDPTPITHRDRTPGTQREGNKEAFIAKQENFVPVSHTMIGMR